MTTKLQPETRAFFFDIFGTCVDWRRSVTTALHESCSKALQDNSALSPSIRQKASSLGEVGWGGIAQEWRTTYYEFTRSLAADPSLRFKTVDQHHLEALIKILAAKGLITSQSPSSTTTPHTDEPANNLFSSEQIEHLSTVWHRLDSWPDTNRGLEIMGAHLATVTLSNGNISLLEDMQRHSGMRFTHTYSSELFGTYKPNPAIYKGAAARLGVQPHQCVMVAAHLGDLEAAKGCGFQTVYVERAGEEKGEVEEEARRKGFVDVWVKLDEGGFLGVVEKLGMK